MDARVEALPPQTSPDRAAMSGADKSRQSARAPAMPAGGQQDSVLTFAGLRRPLVPLTAALAVVSLFFLSFPGVDRFVSAAFFNPGHGFTGAGDFDLKIVRNIGNWMTAGMIGASGVAIFAGLSTRRMGWLLKPSEGLYVLAVYALAPGLIVNGFLKTNAGRARPRNLTEFGGSLDFTPVWQFAGQCSRNCSFSSGEAASAAAALALIFVIRRSDRLPVAIGLASIAAMVSIARVSVGGHFISDVLVSWIITLSTIIVLRPALLGARGARIDAGFARLAARIRARTNAECDVAASPAFVYEDRPSMDTLLSPSSTLSRPRHFAMVSVVVPAKNEAENLAVLVPEIAAALGARAHEIVVVDDGSSDDTAVTIERLREHGIAVRHIRHERSAGQSRAVRTGVMHAAGDCIVTIDGDGQNDPAFIPAMVARLEENGKGCGLVAGQRTGRTDSFTKRLSSKAANRLRTAILNDSTRDTGCGLKAVPAELFRTLPYFDGWHRYLPALVLREELAIAHLDVKDRQRRFGQSNYGIFDRAARGALDLFGVWWIIRRGRRSPGTIADVTATKE